MKVGLIELSETKNGNKMEWISVKDRLPENWQLVIMYQKLSKYDNTLDIAIGSYANGKFHILWPEERRNPTHWMPLPKPPKE